MDKSNFMLYFQREMKSSLENIKMFLSGLYLAKYEYKEYYEKKYLVQDNLLKTDRLDKLIDSYIGKNSNLEIGDIFELGSYPGVWTIRPLYKGKIDWDEPFYSFLLKFDINIFTVMKNIDENYYKTYLEGILALQKRFYTQYFDKVISVGENLFHNSVSYIFNKIFKDNRKLDLLRIEAQNKTDWKVLLMYVEKIKQDTKLKMNYINHLDRFIHLSHSLRLIKDGE